MQSVTKAGKIAGRGGDIKGLKNDLIVV